MSKRGLIIVNAYYKEKSGLNQSQRLKQEFEKLGVEIDIVRNDKFLAYIVNGKIQTLTSQYDFCIYLDKDKYISHLLEKSGLRLFNSADSIETCDDKMMTHIALSNADIKMPKTLSGLLCYTENAEVKAETVDYVEKQLGLPLVIKCSYGSFGNQVFLVKTREELSKKMQELICVPHLFQQYISSSFGMDIRVIVIGGKVFSAMKRVSNGDFRSNIELGGHGEKTVLDKSFVEISEKASKILGLDYCGIDLLIGNSYEPILCEVNSNAFFGAMESVSGENVAKKYAEYIIKEMKL